jgi:hypothetical protein
MLYAAKCFWPGITEAELRAAAERAQGDTEQPRAVFRGALCLTGDQLALCLFESSTPAAVKRASEQAGIPCERVVETVWVSPRKGAAAR